jgi:hypothetical protein
MQRGKDFLAFEDPASRWFREVAQKAREGGRVVSEEAEATVAGATEQAADEAAVVVVIDGEGAGGGAAACASPVLLGDDASVGFWVDSVAGESETFRVMDGTVSGAVSSLGAVRARARALFWIHTMQAQLSRLDGDRDA